MFIGQRPFDSRLYLYISRSFKCPKCSPVVCLIIFYLLREYILKVHIPVSSEMLVSCLVYCFFKQIVDTFFNKAYYQEPYLYTNYREYQCGHRS
jgi:hypothetical protein